MSKHSRYTIAICMAFAAACRNESPTGLEQDRPSRTPPIAVYDIHLTHECGDTVVIRNDLSGPGTSTLFRWKARAAGVYETATILATDTVRISNASDGVSGFTRIAVHPGAAQIGIHLATGSTLDTLYARNVADVLQNPPTCGTRVPLRTVVGPGARFNNSPAVDSLIVGATFEWHAGAIGGADSVEVQVNGVRQTGYQAIVDSTMEAVLLTVSAYWPEPATLPAAAGFITDLRAILSSGTPKAAAQDLLHDLVDYAMNHDTATVQAVFDQVVGRAFDWETELEGIFQLDSLLDGAVFDLSPSGTSLRGSGPADSLSEMTRVVLVNGTFTSEQSLIQAGQVAGRLLTAGSQNLTLTYFLNPSLDRDPLDACLAAIQSATQMRVAVSRFIRACLPVIGGVADVFDPIESVSQILHRYVPAVVPPRAISLRLADSVQAFRDGGAHTVILGHSQGTQVAREAVQELLSSGRYLNTRDSICLGAVAIAGPQGGNWGLSVGQVDEFAATGDLVSSLAPELDRVPTALSIALAEANAVAITPLEVFINTVVYGIKIHNLGGNYLWDPATQMRLRSAVEGVRRECEPGEVVAIAQFDQLHRGDEYFPHLYFQVRNQNGRRIYGRTVKVESNDSAIVNILPFRKAVASSHGSTELIGTVGLASGEMEVTVTPVPDLSVGVAKTGHWFVTGPLIQDSLSLNGLVQLDSVSPTGEYLVTGGTISYQYNGTPYTTPVLNARIDPGGPSPTLRFTMATPEYPSNPFSYAEVQLSLESNGYWHGGATLYYYPGLVREGRGWILNAPD